MKIKAVSGIILTLLLMSMLTLAFSIQPVRSDWTWTETICIRADGSVEPDTAPISTVDNITYTLTDSIVIDADGIVLERDNIVVKGANYTVQGTGSGNGIDLSHRSNVTIKNMEIKVFYRGIGLAESSNNNISGNSITNNDYCGIGLDQSSNNNTISGNTLTGNNGYGIALSRSSNYNSISRNRIANNDWGIVLYKGSNFNTISENNITANNWGGIDLWDFSNHNSISGNNITANKNLGIGLLYSWNNVISGNNITNNDSGIILSYFSNNNTISGNTLTGNNWYGILLDRSSNDTISGNSIANNYYGIGLAESSNNNISGNNIINNGDGILMYQSSNNKFFHNNFVDNGEQVDSESSTNVWNDSYPSGGNYWSDHVAVDDCCGVNQDEPGSDGIVDEPYIIDASNCDNYPLVEPWSPVISATVDIDPDTLNLRSRGQWITAYVELPEGCNVSDMDVSTVMLNDTISVSVLEVPAPEPVPTEIGDYDSDSIPDLMVKFDIAMVSEFILSQGITYGNVTLTITGEVNGTKFEGSDSIRVIFPSRRFGGCRVLKR